jgi:hypothetical protein
MLSDLFIIWFRRKFQRLFLEILGKCFRELVEPSRMKIFQCFIKSTRSLQVNIVHIGKISLRYRHIDTELFVT